MIKASEVYKRFSTVEALKGVSLEVARAEIVAIVGASGAGKSTLLQILGTLLQPDSGKVEIAGTDVCSLSEKQLAAFRNRHIGFVFQFHHLLPEFTALENVMMPALIGGIDKNEASRRAAELLEIVGLSNRSEHKPAQMSGGEQQRVAIARALVCRPSVVLADEPTGNLDSANSAEIQRLLVDVRDRFEQTIVMVTHDMALADSVDRKIVMSDGTIL
ncbi:MAG: ABC transporter ATP-binding protein [Alistipes sp.]|nr:ABC transporter ATP-binding protein [Alistipes sp.]MBQ5855579.1 ABC transporter ATP-binding protein [Alistipes sp.]